MPIQFNCPQCLTPASLDDRFEGCAVNCDCCGRTIIAPMRAHAAGKSPDAHGPAVLQFTRLCGPMGLLASLFALANLGFVIYSLYFLVAASANWTYFFGVVPVYLVLLTGGLWACVRALADGEEGRWLILTALLLLLLPFVTFALIASTAFVIKLL